MQTSCMQDLLSAPPKKKINFNEMFCYAFRLTIGMGLGIILSVASQEIWGFGQMLSIFIVLSCVFLVLRITRKWSLAKVSILGVNFVLFFVFLQTYISVAPE